MLKVLSIQNTVALVDTDQGQVPIDFIPLDVSTLTPEEAFVMGMAYSLLENRGIPMATPADPLENSIDRHSVTEEI